jgi:hypothetical protein
MRTTILAALAAAAVLSPAPTRAAPEPPKLSLPIACEVGRTCEVQHYVDRDPGPGVLDYRCGHRTYQDHNGIDIRLLDMAEQRQGVSVLAAAPGRVLRLRDGVADVSIRDPGAASVKGQECGNGVFIDHGGGWSTQYCHLARGSVRVKPGDVVKAGDPIGRVGLSGQTEFPHLHFTVRNGSAIIDPFAPQGSASGTCAPQGGASLWTPAAQRALAYKAGAILNAGFAGVPLTMDAIEAGGIAAPTADSPALVAYMRAIELEKGDILDLSLKGPDGAVMAAQSLPPLERDKAQYFAMVGRKRPPAGWAKGRYVATLRVLRAGKPALERQVAMTL